MKQAIVLASKSPRRKEILEKSGYDIIIDVSNFDENGVVEEDIKQKVQEIAKGKAMVIVPKHDNSIVIAADTFVYFNGHEIGKEQNDESARKTLMELLGNTHEVFTGIYVINTKTDKVVQDICISKVTLKQVPGFVVDKYISSGHYKGKAGCYNINDPEFESFVDHIEGSYSNIMGLPKERIKNMIDEVSG